ITWPLPDPEDVTFPFTKTTNAAEDDDQTTLLMIPFVGGDKGPAQQWAGFAV
ncbi:MAG: hypothetical protein GY774_26710, partial [Planctomycetes bacterium]|nr:hypothetical protein [Planctomycetota bacterium]